MRNWSENTQKLTPEHIIDDYMRLRLITASENVEEMIEEGKVELGKDYKTTTPCGMEITFKVEKPLEEKPLIMYYQYRLNSDTLKKWIEEHSYMEGPLTFRTRGIQIVYQGSHKITPENYHKVICSIDHEKTESNPMGLQFLDLLITPTTFVVHRGVLNNKEWIVTILS